MPGKLIKQMPKRVKIGHMFFETRAVGGDEAESGGYLGSANPAKGVILVRTDSLPTQQIANTFLHEVMHCIHYVYGISPGEDTCTEEYYTTFTTNGLCAFWMDNPKAADWFSAMMRFGA
ncbi:hypothetical protein LJC19_04810 [Oxalobacter sp. OttesenSCG-928-P03]|nr:hypothetical protein [Oxalobacter sp. OttesenSCG-928-P03]